MGIADMSWHSALEILFYGEYGPYIFWAFLIIAVFKAMGRAPRGKDRGGYLGHGDGDSGGDGGCD
jgi:hypothetical protein